PRRYKHKSGAHHQVKQMVKGMRNGMFSVLNES
ncbi:hypothetical protein SAMN05216563_1411, partial [Phytobacter palmae]